MRILKSDRTQTGFMAFDLAASLALLVLILVPLAYSFQKEQQLCRAYYFRAIAMEIVDGETEILAAGVWRGYQPGVYDYEVTAKAALNLPPGNFLLTLQPDICRLEWVPEKHWKGGRVVREFSTGERQDAVKLSKFQQGAADDN
ncbi:MAG TPA: hypothetical protein EYQ50_09680 [Verrucomicrobiales bacterium]|nr:hypothetical protein [Verrucomicrobiales bacterium]HIL71076.1 hypothetical protein [Verrucomicrobiota bacterium]